MHLFLDSALLNRLLSPLLIAQCLHYRKSVICFYTWEGKCYSFPKTVFKLEDTVLRCPAGFWSATRRLICNRVKPSQASPSSLPAPASHPPGRHRDRLGSLCHTPPSHQLPIQMFWLLKLSWKWQRVTCTHYFGESWYLYVVDPKQHDPESKPKPDLEVGLLVRGQWFLHSLDAVRRCRVSYWGPHAVQQCGVYYWENPRKSGPSRLKPLSFKGQRSQLILPIN